MRRLRRNVIRIAGLLVLGAATTVAVAWGVAVHEIRSLYFNPAPPGPGKPVGVYGHARDQVFVFEPVMRGFGWARREVQRVDMNDRLALQEGSFVHAELTDRMPHGWRTPVANVSDEYHFGFPVHATRMMNEVGWFADMSPSYGWKNAIVIRKGSGAAAISCLKQNIILRKQQTWAPFAAWSRAVVVPAEILPLGLAANTAFYASAWWVAIFGLARSRRWNRQRRGLCARCAYDLRGLENGAKCPECGATRLTNPMHRAIGITAWAASPATHSP